MSKVYSVTLMIAATAYIRAATEAEAQHQVRDLGGCVLEVNDAGGEVAISGLSFDNAALPDVSFAPSMTVQTATADDIDALELVYDAAALPPAGDDTPADRVKAYNAALDALELAPNGDDYNAILDLLDGGAYTAPTARGR